MKIGDKVRVKNTSTEGVVDDITGNICTLSVPCKKHICAYVCHISSLELIEDKTEDNNGFIYLRGNSKYAEKIREAFAVCNPVNLNTIDLKNEDKYFYLSDRTGELRIAQCGVNSETGYLLDLFGEEWFVKETKAIQLFGKEYKPEEYERLKKFFLNKEDEIKIK